MLVHAMSEIHKTLSFSSNLSSSAGFSDALGIFRHAICFISPQAFCSRPARMLI